MSVKYISVYLEDKLKLKDMKLESKHLKHLEHLVPYLPYGLKGFEREYREIMTLTGLGDDRFTMDDGDYDELERFVPILRPLSDFAKTILRDVIKDLQCTHKQGLEFFNFILGDITIDEVSVGLYRCLCKAKVDFNGLIDAGLAIDANNLNA